MSDQDDQFKADRRKRLDAEASIARILLPMLPSHEEVALRLGIDLDDDVGVSFERNATPHHGASGRGRRYHHDRIRSATSAQTTSLRVDLLQAAGAMPAGAVGFSRRGDLGPISAILAGEPSQVFLRSEVPRGWTSGVVLLVSDGTSETVKFLFPRITPPIANVPRFDLAPFLKGLALEVPVFLAPPVGRYLVLLLVSEAQEPLSFLRDLARGTIAGDDVLALIADALEEKPEGLRAGWAEVDVTSRTNQ